MLTESINPEKKVSMEQVHVQQARTMRGLCDVSWGFGGSLLSRGHSSRTHCEDVGMRALRDVGRGHRSPGHTRSLGTKI